MSAERLQVTRLGQRGEGIAAAANGLVYIPYVLPDELVLADVDGDVGHLIEMIAARSDRIAPICPYFETCGGCAVQALPPPPYAEWKLGLIVAVLAKAGIPAEVEAVVDGHGAGRRRATFHARLQASPNVLAERRLRVGFMRARAHEVVDLEFCPILAPSMANALPAARSLSASLMGTQKPVDLTVTATDTGLDIDLRGTGPLDPALAHRLADKAALLDLARLANHGEIVIERRAPLLRIGKAHVAMPPGAFLQATREGEEALARLVLAGVGSAKTIADLFCGVGTFSLRLAENATVHAVDLENPSLNALSKASRFTAGVRPVTTEARDLFRRPVAAPALAAFDAVVFDPPRAGAMAQAEQLAASKVPVVVAVSCNPATFARDAVLLIGGGYRLTRLTPVDQFRYSPHIEMVAVFKREKETTRRKRALFG